MWAFNSFNKATGRVGNRDCKNVASNFEMQPLQIFSPHDSSKIRNNNLAIFFAFIITFCLMPWGKKLKKVSFNFF